MRTPRWPDSPQLGPLTFVALAGTVLLIAAGGQGAEPRADAEEQPRWQGLVADARTRAMIGQRTLVVLRAPAVAQYVARAGGRASEEDQRRWRAKVVAGQKLLLSRLALEGL